MGQQSKTKNRPPTEIERGRNKIKIMPDNKTSMNASSYLNSKDYIDLATNASPSSKLPSSSRGKRSGNSFSFINNVQVLQVITRAREKKQANIDMKIKSVSRSFSRRKFTEKEGELIPEQVNSMPKPPSSGKINSGTKQPSQGSANLRKKRASKDEVYIKSIARRNRSVDDQTPVETNRELLTLDSLYRNKEYHQLVEQGEKFIEESILLRNSSNITFLMAMSYYKLENYIKAKEYFEKLFLLKEKCKKSVYIFLAVCLYNLKELDQAQSILTKACTIYPKFYEAKVPLDLTQIYSAKILAKKHQYDEAIEAYKQAISIEAKNRYSVYMGIGNCYKQRGDHESALNYFNTAVANAPELLRELGTKRAACLVELKLYEKALEEIERVKFWLRQILGDDEENCEALYWKARVMKETGNDDTAILIYEQAINLNKSQTATLNSIYDLTILRILERDIYLAYYTLDRLEDIPEDLVDLNLLKLFINGAINMLKKKFQDGIDTLTKIDLEKLKEERLVRLVHSYRAYGLFSLGKITEALEIYKMLEERNWIVEGDIYNKLICKGIIAGEQNKFDVAEGHFKMARTMFRLRVEPTLYLCVGSFYILVPKNTKICRREQGSI